MPFDDSTEPSGEPLPDARELATEAIRHLLIWIADAPTMLERGLRASVALNCLRPDLLRGTTLERLGADAGRGAARVHQLATEFRLMMNGTIQP